MRTIAAALLGLIAVLATLQYRWLGQISGAERERMTATLNTRTAGFEQDFDRELTRAYLLFQIDSALPEDRLAAEAVSRYDRWQATARFPRLIKEIYIAAPSHEAEPLPLRRFDPASRFLEPAAWPQALAPIRAELPRLPAVHDTAPSSMPNVLYRTMMPMSWPDIPALVIPSPIMMLSRGGGRADVRVTPELRHTILLLDADEIRREMLPALAQQYFRGTGDGFDYHVAVVSSAGGGLVYRSSPEFAPRADARADATVDFFQVRVQAFAPLVAEVARFATFTSTAPGRGGPRTQTIVRQTVTATDSSDGLPAPFSIVLQGPGGGPMSDKLEKIMGSVGVGDRVVTANRLHWRLLAQHPSGSLERAVNAARRRNLAISTGILAVLGLSVGFLIVSTRRAQDLARQQLEFVATVSHELRTPLAVIRSAADNLADGVVDDEARVRQYGQLVRHEGIRLSDLVEQILEFAGLQAGRRTIAAKPVDVGALLRDVIATVESTPDASGVTIELTLADRLPAVAGDEPALRRVFQNLVSNAIKYGARAGWVGVAAQPAAGGGVEITVSDRGIGISAADQDRIFSPFYRAPDVVAAQIQGAGLGLSLVKRIVEAHGGRVHVKSAPGEGSAFIVILPVVHGDGVEGTLGAAEPQHS